MRSSEWLEVRKAWKTAHPPNHEGYYVCGICAKPVHADDVEIDHIVPRGSSQSSSADWDNLQPAHSICNRQKGSRHLKPLISKAEYELRRLLDL